MTNQTDEPGPGRSTSYAAFTTLKKEIARRYEHAEKDARELRAALEPEQGRRHRRDDDTR